MDFNQLTDDEIRDALLIPSDSEDELQLLDIDSLDDPLYEPNTSDESDNEDNGISSQHASQVYYSYLKMASNSDSQRYAIAETGVLTENDQEVLKSQRDNNSKYKLPDPNWKCTDHIVWINVAFSAFAHITAIYGVYLILTFQVKFQTIVFAVILSHLGGIGITAGNHRLWSHRSYKARLPVRIFLATCQTIAMQDHIYNWVRNHRVHHKFSETDADPHNASRGFFFAHMGWLMCRKHPEVIARGKTLDLSDLECDPVVMFQKKYYLPLSLVISVIIPSLLPYYAWGETYIAAYCVATICRYVVSLHITWLVNSAAHLFGNHPYDKNINPGENIIVSFLALGEGWHNYHHTFPWDYKTSELGFSNFNVTTGLIDLWYKLGLVYDLKSVSKDVVMRRCHMTGDGTHAVWGWGDKDFEEELIINGHVTKSD